MGACGGGVRQYLMIVAILCFAAFIVVLICINKFCTDDEKDSNNNNSDSYLTEIQTQLKELSKIPKDSEKKAGKYLFFDTETTGLPKRRNAKPENFANWPYVVDIAWYLIDEDGLMVNGSHYIVKQDIEIPEEASDIHHITTEKMLSEGKDPKTVYAEFIEDVNNTEYVIAHNLEFDLPIVECELLRNGFPKVLSEKKQFCTMKAGKNFCEVYDSKGKRKFPNLTELFGELYFDNHFLKFNGTHNALADTNMLYRCFMKMIELEPNLLNEVNYNSEEVTSIRSQSVIVPTDMQHEHLSGDILKKDLSNADPQSPFYNKKIVITGVFPIERYELALILKIKMGADIDTSIGKNTKILLVGDDPGPMKVSKALEANIEIYDIDKTMKAIEPYR